MLTAIAITASFSYFGIWTIVNYPNFLTITLGLGLMAAGFMILFFLIKFIFATNKTDTSEFIEVTQEEQPELFAMIHQLVNEIKTDFPQKVFLTYNVNASVFYNSSFWSMFFPVRKNLQIGVGLINSLTNQELRAILAHEFGHFSQRSMKVGSYVYNVNNVIFNMLYNNESLRKMHENIAGLSSYLALPLYISIFSINGIQKILQKLYDYININYLALSREMEFHADEIAANVAGSKAMADSLQRLSFANHSLESVISFYEKNHNQNWLPKDIYENQQVVNLFLAKKNNYEINNGFPMVPLDAESKYNKSKLNIENQWQSHPSTQDRIRAIAKMDIQVDYNNQSPAIELLKNKDNLFQKIKNHLFVNLNHQGPIKQLDTLEFQQNFVKDFEKNDFDEMYNDFYFFINPIIEDFSKLDYHAEPISISELFSDHNRDLSFDLNSLLNDKQTLTDIKNKTYKIKSFDYDGVKYKSSDANQILKSVEIEIQAKQAQINEINTKSFETFYSLADNDLTKSQLKKKYEVMKEMEASFENRIQFYYDLTQRYAFVYEQIEYTEIISHLMKNKSLETRLKTEISSLLSNSDLTVELAKDTLDGLTRFVNNDLVYFEGSAYHDDNLNLLFTAIHQYYYMTFRAYFLHKYNLLNFQKHLYRGS
ncbi:M48 family metalloprotease [Sphingobacterium mizutaii]|uniref:M48 family metalloprotease n=1 Tax=Sphingobacterium mizutaii TaxID=1010 RepID=UPI001629ACCB|nr:M48 family metallopeptidase [Sphingobacterium mizutaii]